MAAPEKIVNIVQDVTSGMQSKGSSQIANTDSRTGDGASVEERQKTILFFNRLRNIYGRRFSSQWSDEKTLQLTRREWAPQIGQYSLDELELALERTKQKLIDEDQDYFWPDIGRILALARSSQWSGHKVHRAGLPESEAVKRSRLKAARAGMSRVMGLMGRRYAD